PPLIKAHTPSISLDHAMVAPLNRRARNRPLTAPTTPPNREIPPALAVSMTETYRTAKRHGGLALRRPRLATQRQAYPPSLLLRLPAELRNAIYRLVVSEATPIKVQERNPSRKHGAARTGLMRILTPDILAVNRQIQREARAVFYGENDFIVSLLGWGRQCVLLHQIARNDDLLAIKRVRVECLQHIAELAACAYGSEVWQRKIVECIAEYDAEMEEWVQSGWRVEGWCWLYDVGSAREVWDRKMTQHEDGIWDAEVARWTRGVARGLFRFPLAARGVETLWVPVAKLREWEVVEEGGVKGWVRQEV
ncbi:hypothetical protein LTR53_007426, partial [Teratosphaeriaceae sp. CCFEE 6253]